MAKRTVADILRTKGTWSGTIKLGDGYSVKVTGLIADRPTIGALADIIRNGAQNLDKAGLMKGKAPAASSEPINGVSLEIPRAVRATPEDFVDSLYASVGLETPAPEPVAPLPEQAPVLNAPRTMPIAGNGKPLPTAAKV